MNLSKLVRMARTQISDDEFFNILRANAGVFVGTAEAIRKKYGIPYTRQSVRERALNHPAILDEIRETVKDIAEATIISLMQETDSDQLKYKIATDYLERFAKDRGYTRKADIEFNQYQNLPSKPMTEQEMIAYIKSLRSEFDKD